MRFLLNLGNLSRLCREQDRAWASASALMGISASRGKILVWRPGCQSCSTLAGSTQPRTALERIRGTERRAHGARPILLVLWHDLWMSFKVDSSFLKYLTMGASATLRVMQLMRDAGLQPIELERYASTNKIWATKVKRLRLPDLLCLRTGLRVEVRGKSKLELRMSDAPNNRQRRWFSGMRSNDLITFVKCETGTEKVITAEEAEFFWVGDLRRSFAQAKLGSRKSAAEGSEQDVCWPTTVAKANGVVLAVSKSQIKVELDSGRRQTYQLGRKTPYVAEFELFEGGTQFLAGAPKRKASLNAMPLSHWNPRSEQKSAIDRFVCAKALGQIGTKQDWPLLHKMEADKDPRVALEASAALANLGDPTGLARIGATIEAPSVDFLRMESVFILGEIRGTLADEAARLLEEVAASVVYPDEVCQAAIWCLGHKGHGKYGRLIQFLGGPTENQRLHAIAAFGSDVPRRVCKALVNVIADDRSSDFAKSAAGEVLSRLYRPERALPYLLAVLAHEGAGPRALSVIGSMDANFIANTVKDKEILKAILPVQLASKSKNWTKSPASAESLSFLSKQVL